MIEKPQEITTLPTNNIPNPQTILNSFNQPIFPSNRSSVLALVESIADENHIFKSQQQNIEQQLRKLRKISQSLLKENIQLRSLYRQRTTDISKLLNTITINTNEAIVDYQHRQFLMKELNCGILKQIKLIAKQIEALSQDIKNSQQQSNQLDDNRMKMEQQTVNKIKIKLKSDLNKKQLQKYSQKQLQQLQTVNDISSEVIDLTLQIKELESILQNHQQNSRNLYSTLEKDKQEWKNRLQYLMAQNKKYKAEIKNDEANEQKNAEELKYKKQKHLTTKNNLNQEIKKSEKYKRINQEHQSQKEKIKRKIKQSKKRMEVAQAKLDEMKRQKVQASQKLANKKEKLKFRQAEFK